MRPGAAMGDRASDRGRGILRRNGLRARRPGPHHGGYRGHRRSRRGVCRKPRGHGAGASARRHSDHHRSARSRFRRLQAPQADAWHGRHRSAADPGIRSARRDDDEHLHQLSDHPAAGARRASGLRRYRRRDLLERRARRAQQLRGRPVGLVRRADRTHAALRLSSRPSPDRHQAFHGVVAAARSERLGRARRYRRQADRQLLGGAGRFPDSSGFRIPTSSSISARRWRVSARSRCFTCPVSRRTRQPCAMRSAARSRRRPPRSPNEDLARFLRPLCRARRKGRCRGVFRAATVAGRNESGRRPARRPAGSRRIRR